MSRPIVKIHNIETDEVFEREMNDQEFAQYEIDQAKFAAEKLNSPSLTKEAVLAKLGLTAEEAATLLT